MGIKLPSASATIDGIITNATQTIGGVKTFLRESTSGNLTAMVLAGYGSSGNGYPTLNLLSGRGTNASPGQSLSGDILGSMRFFGYNSTPSLVGPGARIDGVTTQNWAGGAQGTKLDFYTTETNSNIPVVALSLDHNAAVTLGTSSGSNTLDHFANAGAGVTFSLRSGTGTSNAILYLNRNGTQDAAFMCAGSNGSGVTGSLVGDAIIGVLGGGRRLLFTSDFGSTIAGSMNGNQWTFGSTAHTGNHVFNGGSGLIAAEVISVRKAGMGAQSNNNIYMVFAAGGSNDGTIQTNGSAVLTIVDVSDARLKTNIRDAEYGLDTIMALRPVTFDWLARDIQNVKGFIAQEVELVLPESVVTHDHSDTGGLADTKLLETQTMIPVLVKALQELKQQFDDYVSSHP